MLSLSVRMCIERNFNFFFLSQIIAASVVVDDDDGFSNLLNLKAVAC